MSPWVCAAVVAVLAACGVEREPIERIDGQLSGEGLYADIARKTIGNEARELAPKYALWTDGAAKQRWLVLPPGTEIDTSDMDHWEVPVGTKLFKEFSVDGRRVETRMIERVSKTEYRFAPFVWLPDQSDAVFTPDGARNVAGTGHDVPASDVCMTCHQSEPGRVLGVSAVQLADMIDKLPLSRRPSQPLAIPEPALGVLHANCGHCHNERGIAPMQTLRFSVDDASKPIEDTAPYRTTVGVKLSSWVMQGFDVRIARADPFDSAILYRMSQRGDADQMPPIGTARVDEVGVETVRNWIVSLGPEIAR